MSSTEPKNKNDDEGIAPAAQGVSRDSRDASRAASLPALVDMLYANAASSQRLVLLAAAVLAAAQWRHLPHALVLTWYTAISAITLGRIALTAAYRRRVHAHDAARWARRFIVGAGCSGVAWGSAAVLMLSTQEFGPQLVTALVIAGTVAAGVPYLAASLPAANLFSIAALAPMFGLFLLQPEDSYVALAIVTLIYLAAMIGLARRINASILATLALRGENRELVANLTEAKQRAEAANAELTAEIAERRRIEQNLAESLSLVQATLDSTADGILAVDRFGNIVSFNQRFQMMWAIPDAAADLMNTKALIAHVLTQVASAREFMAGIRQIYGSPALESFDVLELKDGRIVERFSMPQRVDGRIVGRVWSFRDISERRRAEAGLQFAANHDQLTALPNRAAFANRVHEALLRAERHARQLAVMFVDLDRFKNINDSLGHPAGDKLLKEVAARLLRTMRKTDCVARFGGDEFVVLLDDVAAAMPLGRSARRIIEVLSQPYLIDGHECHLTASIGISLYPDDGKDAQGLLKNADIAMYRAKEQGKNGFAFYSSTLNLHSVERLALEASLRRATDANDFVLHYQPRIDLATDRINGVEALVRWPHPELGIVPPGTFIPIAEETGLIERIGEWVLRTACRQAVRWQTLGLPRMRMAVNLSARQFAHAALDRQIKSILDETGLEPDLLELELTESTVMRDANRAIETMQRLAALGIHLSIDDFGTGYSSLGSLKRFPIDAVKIDRSFVHDVPDSRDDAALAIAIIGMAHTLRMRAVAEGVETEAQAEFLRRHGCDEVQGFYFGKPMPAADLERRFDAEAVARVTNMTGHASGGRGA